MKVDVMTRYLCLTGLRVITFLRTSKSATRLDLGVEPTRHRVDAEHVAELIQLGGLPEGRVQHSQVSQRRFRLARTAAGQLIADAPPGRYRLFLASLSTRYTRSSEGYNRREQRHMGQGVA